MRLNDIYLERLFKISRYFKTEAVTNFEKWELIDTIHLRIGLNFRTPIVGFSNRIKNLCRGAYCLKSIH